MYDFYVELCLCNSVIASVYKSSFNDIEKV